MKFERKEHPTYSKPSKVYIVKKKNKRKCLEEAVEKSGFIAHLNEEWKESRKPKEQFSIAIKPNIMTAAYERDISVFTDVELVEHLIGMMRHEGYEKISVVESQMVWSLFYEDRTVKNVAEMVGYSSDGYEVVDLTLTMEEDYDYGDNELGKHPAGPAWRDADYRISFAKNKTHFQCYYTGCMKNIYGCLPEKDKLKSYHGRLRKREFHSCTIAILEAFPVHFAFLDAYFSGDGFAGLVRDSKPNETNTIICGENCLAVDWVQGEKMDIHPMRNYVIQRAVERWGEPQIQRIGPMEKYKSWKNVLRGMDKIINLFEEFYLPSYFVCCIFAYRMHPEYERVRNWTYKLSWPFRFLVKNFDNRRGLILLLLIVVLVIGFVFGMLTANI